MLDDLRAVLREPGAGTTATLTFLDEDGKKITSDSFALATKCDSFDVYASPLYPMPREVRTYFGPSNNFNTFVISPLFFFALQAGYDSHRYFPSLQIGRQIQLSLDEVKAIKSIKCEITANKPVPDGR